VGRGASGKHTRAKPVVSVVASEDVSNTDSGNKEPHDDSSNKDALDKAKKTTVRF